MKAPSPEPDQAPAGASKQDAEPAGAYVPAGHILLFLFASVVPCVGHAYPAGHGVQEV